jgi:hypothetical protein
MLRNQCGKIISSIKRPGGKLPIALCALRVQGLMSSEFAVYIKYREAPTKCTLIELVKEKLIKKNCLSYT